MKVSRREFLAATGIIIAGIVTKPIFDALSRPEEASPVATGTRWAMVINLNACLAKDGCVDCIDACHRYHNVPYFPNPKHEIKWLWTIPFEQAFPAQKHEFIKLKGLPTLVLCNHCDNPPCQTVCPTRATWKREDGIVMMDYHRCIGCRYCMVACPYGARSFNWLDPRPYIDEINPEFPLRTIGVVEKCGFCEQRLAQGLPPACVEACQEKAIVFGDLNDPNAEVREILRVHYTIQRKPYLGVKPRVFYIV
ncbi:4Fe-4S dicluster domain-containing protein [Dehalococcoidales bacterium]|nr:4Fe-4S dicluster domain-containing protein [Dehalococcoidales bacterium]